MLKRTEQILRGVGLPIGVSKDDIYDCEKDDVTLAVDSLLNAMNRLPRRVAVRACYIAYMTVTRPAEWELEDLAADDYKDTDEKPD